MHLQDALNQGLQQKQQMRTELKGHLDRQSKTFSDVEKDAQTLLLKALHAGRKVTVRVRHQPNIIILTTQSSCAKRLLSAYMLTALCTIRHCKQRWTWHVPEVRMPDSSFTTHRLLYVATSLLTAVCPVCCVAA